MKSCRVSGKDSVSGIFSARSNNKMTQKPSKNDLVDTKIQEKKKNESSRYKNRVKPPIPIFRDKASQKSSKCSQVENSQNNKNQSNIKDSYFKGKNFKTPVSKPSGSCFFSSVSSSNLEQSTPKYPLSEKRPILKGEKKGKHNSEISKNNTLEFPQLEITAFNPVPEEKELQSDDNESIENIKETANVGTSRTEQSHNTSNTEKVKLIQPKFNDFAEETRFSSESRKEEKLYNLRQRFIRICKDNNKGVAIEDIIRFADPNELILLLESLIKELPEGDLPSSADSFAFSDKIILSGLTRFLLSNVQSKGVSSQRFRRRRNEKTNRILYIFYFLHINPLSSTLKESHKNESKQVLIYSLNYLENNLESIGNLSLLTGISGKNLLQIGEFLKEDSSLEDLAYLRGESDPITLLVLYTIDLLLHLGFKENFEKLVKSKTEAIKKSYSTASEKRKILLEEQKWKLRKKLINLKNELKEHIS